MPWLSHFRTEVVTDEDFGPCPAPAETLPRNTQVDKQRKEIWSISQRDYGPTQGQRKKMMSQVLQLTKSPGNEQMTDVLRQLFLSWHFLLLLSSKRTEENEVEKNTKNDFSLHLHCLKVTYVMARTLTLVKMVCPPKFREDFNFTQFVLGI